MNALIVASRSTTTENGGWSPVGRLSFEQGVYRFVYTQGARTAQGFRPFDGMKDFEQIYESEHLFPIFANRLLPKSRPEYDDFLRWSGFDPKQPPEPIAILGVTEGIKPTDMIEVFPCPVPNEKGLYENKFFVHGLRYMSQAAQTRLNALQAGEQLLFLLDIQNSADPDAVTLRTTDDRMLIGYVPRYLAQDVWSLMNGCGPEYLGFFVHRINKDAPLQQRLLCRVEACWPPDFKPCDGEQFHPIPKNVPVRCDT